MPTIKVIDSRAVVNRSDFCGLIVDTTQAVETLDRLGSILATVPPPEMAANVVTRGRCPEFQPTLADSSESITN
jgi:hypothetical protein